MNLSKIKKVKLQKIWKTKLKMRNSESRLKNKSFKLNKDKRRNNKLKRRRFKLSKDKKKKR